MRGPAAWPQKCSWFITFLSVDVETSWYHACRLPSGNQARGSCRAGVSKTCFTPRRHCFCSRWADRKTYASGSRCSASIKYLRNGRHASSCGERTAPATRRRAVITLLRTRYTPACSSVYTKMARAWSSTYPGASRPRRLSRGSGCSARHDARVATIPSCPLIRASTSTPCACSGLMAASRVAGIGRARIASATMRMY